jgi:hypothetical protein
MIRLDSGRGGEIGNRARNFQNSIEEQSELDFDAQNRSECLKSRFQAFPMA